MTARHFQSLMDGIELSQWQKWTTSYLKTWQALNEECYDFALLASLKAASMPLLAFRSMSDSEISSEAPSA
jgi:hypothetical protein